MANNDRVTIYGLNIRCTSLNIQSVAESLASVHILVKSFVLYLLEIIVCSLTWYQFVRLSSQFVELLISPDY
jgi:hypothetical protein